MNYDRYTISTLINCSEGVFGDLVEDCVNDYLEVMGKRANWHLVDPGETNSVVQNHAREILAEQEQICGGRLEDRGDEESVTKDSPTNFTEQEYFKTY